MRGVSNIIAALSLILIAVVAVSIYAFVATHIISSRKPTYSIFAAAVASVEDLGPGGTLPDYNNFPASHVYHFVVTISNFADKPATLSYEFIGVGECGDYDSNATLKYINPLRLGENSFPDNIPPHSSLTIDFPLITNFDLDNKRCIYLKIVASYPDGSRVWYNIPLTLGASTHEEVAGWNVPGLQP